MKIIQIAEGAFFVPSYSEQTIIRAYKIDTTVQSFGFDQRPSMFGGLLRPRFASSSIRACAISDAPDIASAHDPNWKIFCWVSFTAVSPRGSPIVPRLSAATCALI